MQNEQNTAAILERYPAGVRENLIAILQDVQDSQGALSRTAIIAIARHLGLAAGKVYGVATFYNQFRFENTGIAANNQIIYGVQTVLHDIKARMGIVLFYGIILEKICCIG